MDGNVTISFFISFHPGDIMLRLGLRVGKLGGILVSGEIRLPGKVSMGMHLKVTSLGKVVSHPRGH